MDINGKKISKQKHPNSPPCQLEWSAKRGLLQCNTITLHSGPCANIPKCNTLSPLNIPGYTFLSIPLHPDQCPGPLPFLAPFPHTLSALSSLRCTAPLLLTYVQQVWLSPHFSWTQVARNLSVMYIGKASSSHSV